MTCKWLTFRKANNYFKGLTGEQGAAMVWNRLAGADESAAEKLRLINLSNHYQDAFKQERLAKQEMKADLLRTRKRLREVEKVMRQFNHQINGLRAEA